MHCVLGKRNIIELEMKEKAVEIVLFKVFHFRAIGRLSKDSIKVLRRTHASL